MAAACSRKMGKEEELDEQRLLAGLHCHLCQVMEAM